MEAFPSSWGTGASTDLPKLTGGVSLSLYLQDGKYEVLTTTFHNDKVRPGSRILTKTFLNDYLAGDGSSGDFLHFSQWNKYD